MKKQKSMQSSLKFKVGQSLQNINTMDKYFYDEKLFGPQIGNDGQRLTHDKARQ